MKHFGSLLILISILFFGCDKVQFPNDGTPIKTEPTNQLKRKILVEEFTGHMCTFCPGAAREIERLVDVYGDQIIPVAIYAGGYAAPAPPKAPEDFRTPEGDAYLSMLKPGGFPKAFISRTGIPPQPYGKAQFETEILSIKDDEPIVDLKLSTSYNSSNREVSIDVEAEWLKSGDNGIDYNIVLLVIEDHIIAYQMDDGVDVTNYDHRHMLRSAVNSTQGDVINNTSEGSTYQQNYKYTLDSGWKENDCEIVAYIYKNNDPDFEVIQAEKEYVTD